MTDQLDIVQQVLAVSTAEQLIAETIALKDKVALGAKQFEDWAKPFKAQIAENENKLLALLNEQRLDSVRSDAGTAYKSTITSYKVTDRDAVLKLILDNWQNFGSEMLMMNIQKDSVKRYVEENGQLPPGVASDAFVRINIRRS